MAAVAAVGYSRGRLSIDSTSTMSSAGSGPVSSSPSASSSTSSPPVHGGNMDMLMADGVVTKIEELDNDDELRNVPPLPSPSTESGEPSKRGRGRPRKHPLPPIGTQTKITKGRSKTGCITCRRRKKKCDEAKPECNNCIKNAVVCEGYPEKTVWQSGRQKAEGESVHRTYTPNDRLLTPFTGRNFNHSAAIVRFADLPCLIDGVETRIDRALLDHFVRNVSRILTLFNDATNPFQEMLLPLALENRGLMHSLLCLSGSHLSNTDPSFSVAQHHHFGKAMQYLRCDPAVTGQIPIAGDPTIATTLILCLNSICKGETEGEYRPHLDAARHMLAFANSGNRNNNPSFSNFLYEFFMYHDVINSVTTLDRRPLLLMENYTLPAFIIQPEAGALLGVLDGLFGYLSKITLLRDHIRGRKTRGDHPAVDYEVLSQAVAIDSEIRDWVPAQTPASHRYIAAQLYRQSTWVYLYRTIMPSTASPKIDVAVEEGLEYLRHLPENSGTQSILLMPLFILGCAAFNPEQRPEISRRFVGLHEYSGLGNIVTAHEVVKKVWALMDSGEEEKSWDWEKIIQEMGYDFLVT